MKTLLILSLLLIAALCKSSAQTNEIPPELRKAMKEAEDRHQFFLTNERPIQASASLGEGYKGGNQCQVSYVGRTNLVVYIPIPEQQFDFRLFSMDGKEIPKRSNYKFGQKLKPDKSLFNGDPAAIDAYSDSYSDNIYERRLDFKNFNHSHFWRFDILKSFKIKEPGEYRLQVQVRLFTKDTNGVFQPFILPPVETKVSISENDLGK
jgi:hypothetical protein